MDEVLCLWKNEFVEEEEGGVFICERAAENPSLSPGFNFARISCSPLRPFSALCGSRSGSKAELALKRKSIVERGVTNNGSGGSILV
jgi:hypothetical protein